MPTEAPDALFDDDAMEASSDNEALISSDTRSSAFMRGMMEQPPAAWLSRKRTRHLATSDGVKSMKTSEASAMLATYLLGTPTYLAKIERDGGPDRARCTRLYTTGSSINEAGKASSAIQVHGLT